VVRLLAFSDLHTDRRRAERLVTMAEEADVVIGAGDFATMHRGLESTIEALSAIAVPAVLVPGNAETDIELWQACASWKSAHVLHGEAKEIAGAQFFGLGGGVLAAMERKRPVLAVCGHVHQCWGREATIGTTPVVNVGPEGRFFEI
jgi:uncharacterized protein